MNRTLYFGTAVISAILILGSIFIRDSILMALASNSETVIILRIISILILLVLFTLDTIKHTPVKFVLFLGGSFAIVMAIVGMWYDTVHLFDAINILAFGLSLLVAGSERSPDQLQENEIFNPANVFAKNLQSDGQTQDDIPESEKIPHVPEHTK